MYCHSHHEIKQQHVSVKKRLLLNKDTEKFKTITTLIKDVLYNWVVNLFWLLLKKNLGNYDKIFSNKQ